MRVAAFSVKQTPLLMQFYRSTYVTQVKMFTDKVFYWNCIHVMFSLVSRLLLFVLFRYFIQKCYTSYLYSTLLCFVSVTFWQIWISEKLLEVPTCSYRNDVFVHVLSVFTIHKKTRLTFSRHVIMAVMEVVLGVPGDEGHCCSIRDLHHTVLSQVV